MTTIPKQNACIRVGEKERDEKKKTSTGRGSTTTLNIAAVVFRNRGNKKWCAALLSGWGNAPFSVYFFSLFALSLRTSSSSSLNKKLLTPLDLNLSHRTIRPDRFFFRFQCFPLLKRMEKNDASIIFFCFAFSCSELCKCDPSWYLFVSREWRKKVEKDENDTVFLKFFFSRSKIEFDSTLCDGVSGGKKNEDSSSERANLCRKIGMWHNFFTVA